jgi:hypothetical protein
VDDPSYTVNQFCHLERISRSKLYDDWAANRGPRFYYNGKQRRISHEARVDWRRQREAEAAALEAALGDDKAA